MIPKLAVFDMAGTTVYDGDAVHRALMQALNEAEVHPSREAVNAVMGIPKPVAIQTLLRQAGHASAEREEEVDALFRRFEEHMLRHYHTSPEVREITGASEVFRLLQGFGCRVALDTGFSRSIAEAVLHKLGWQLGQTVDVLVAGDDVARGRPYPDQIEKAMHLCGIGDPASAAKIGDTPADLQQGTSAGCGWVIGVCRGSHTREELSGYPHSHLVETVADLPALFGLA
jgi:phosphonatase-like hydrolase